ncbi:MAG: hypothetical protein J6Y08_06625 [Clostridiales bacterium]|nr:hypothetical protein [Clostridiales bacterium]
MRIRTVAAAAGCVLAMLFSSVPTLAFSRDGGTMVVDGKAFASTQDCKGTNWEFDADTHTLYLKGYDGSYIDLSMQEEATVVLEGNNKITSNLDNPALLVQGNLTVMGDGYLDLEVTACRSALYAHDGSLTIYEGCEIRAYGSGTSTTGGYLVMADADVLIENAKVTIEDEVEGQGGGLGSNNGDVYISEDTTLSITSASKALSSLSGSVHIRGAATEVSIHAYDNSIYSRNDLAIVDGATVSVKSDTMGGTVVYCPEGCIRIRSAKVTVEGKKTAMAGQQIELTDAYIATPFDADIQQVADMTTLIFEGEVVSSVEIEPGTAPTPTPTPTPTNTPTPVPTQAPAETNDSAFSITPRMIIGAVLVIVGLGTVIVLLISKIRNKNY